VATTAVHTLSWVWSEAVNEVTLVKVSPALSVTVFTTAAEPLHTPTWTISRLFFVVFNGVVTARVVLLAVWAETFWTKPVDGATDGVTGADGADAGLVPTALVAVTENVYTVPLASPEMVVDGPVTTAGDWATEPTNGVTVYDVMGDPPSPGAVQLTSAEPLPAVATTPVGASGAVAGPLVPPLNTTVPSSQTVLAPVPTVAAGVAPVATVWSSASRSMFPFGDMLVRAVHPDPPVSALPKPESA